MPPKPPSISNAKIKRDAAIARAEKAKRDAHTEFTNVLRRQIEEKGHGAVAVELGITRQSLYETLKRYPA